MRLTTFTHKDFKCKCADVCVCVCVCVPQHKYLQLVVECVCVCVHMHVQGYVPAGIVYVLGSEYVSVYARVFICLSTPCSPPSPPDSFALLSFLPPS